MTFLLQRSVEPTEEPPVAIGLGMLQMKPLSRTGAVAKGSRDERRRPHMMETRATLAVDRRVSRSATEARAARRVDAAPMAIPAAASACRCASPSLASFTARYAACILRPRPLDDSPVR